MTSKRPACRLVVLVGIAACSLAMPVGAQVRPELVGTCCEGMAGTSIAVAGHYAHVATPDPEGMMVVDVSNPRRPEEIASIDFGEVIARQYKY